MAGHLVLHSFVNKFMNLWSSGKNARLSVECQAGQATVNLQLDLGLPHAQPQEHQEKRVGPSRLRRRAQRAQARAEAAVNAAQATAAVDAADVSVQPTNTNTTAVQAAPSTTDTAVQAELEPATVQGAAAHAQPHIFLPTVQASEPCHVLAAEQVRDTFCHDKEYRSAAQAAPLPHYPNSIPQLDGFSNQPDLEDQTDEFWCKCCRYAQRFDTEEEIEQHHRTHMVTFEECNICYTKHVWT
jgi:hypothetical protein